MKDKIFNVFKKCILEKANVKYKNVRTRKCNLDYYLDCFILLLNELNSWKTLTKLKSNNNKFHWKTVYNEHRKWCNDNIFKDAFDTFIKNNYFKHSNVRQNKKLNLFIDVTKIHNLKGSEGITINNEYRKKNITPLTVVCDKNKLPLCVSVLPCNKIFKNGRKTTCHDVKGIQPSLDSLGFANELPIPNYVVCNVIGDKGYISKNKYFIGKRNVTLITPKRKNQKEKTTNYDKKQLRDRYKVENLFATIKAYNRVNVRHETKLNTYLSFVYMSFLIEHIKHCNK
jgi:hypothetical protein